MLLALAWKASDYLLSEAFYGHTTFKSADGCASRPKEEEDALAMSLAVRLSNKENENVTETADKDEESDEEECVRSRIA
jgi:hypothetical protein